MYTVLLTERACMVYPDWHIPVVHSIIALFLAKSIPLYGVNRLRTYIRHFVRMPNMKYI